MWECSRRESHPGEVSAALAQRRRMSGCGVETTNGVAGAAGRGVSIPRQPSAAATAVRAATRIPTYASEKCVPNVPRVRLRWQLHYTDDEFDFAHAGHRVP